MDCIGTRYLTMLKRLGLRIDIGGEQLVLVNTYMIGLEKRIPAVGCNDVDMTLWDLVPITHEQMHIYTFVSSVHNGLTEM